MWKCFTSHLAFHLPELQKHLSLCAQNLICVKPRFRRESARPCGIFCRQKCPELGCKYRARTACYAQCVEFLGQQRSLHHQYVFYQQKTMADGCLMLFGYYHVYQSKTLGFLWTLLQAVERFPTITPSSLCSQLPSNPGTIINHQESGTEPRR